MNGNPQQPGQEQPAEAVKPEDKKDAPAKEESETEE